MSKFYIVKLITKYHNHVLNKILLCQENINIYIKIEKLYIIIKIYTTKLSKIIIITDTQ